MTSVILPVPLIQQRDEGECLAACAAMVLDYMGMSVPYARLLKLLRIQWFGTASFRIHELEKLGLVVAFKEGTLEELHDHLAQDRPCITPVKTAELPYRDDARDHAVVVVGLDDKHVYLNDPDFPNAPIEASHGDFGLAWLGRDELYATFMRRD